MKFVCSSDWHPDVTTLGVSRFNEVQRAVRKSVEHAIAIKADRYLFLGDLCDPDSGPIVFRCVGLALWAATTLEGAGIPSHWLVGNHDVIEDGSGTSTLQPLRDAGFDVMDQPQAVGAGGCEILALPFTAASHPYQPERAVQQLFDGSKTLVLSHLGIEGIQPGEETKDMPRGREVVFPHASFPSTLRDVTILSGHYHQKQVFERPGLLPIHVVGSLARLTFGESNNEPSFLVVEV